MAKYKFEFDDIEELILLAEEAKIAINADRKINEDRLKLYDVPFERSLGANPSGVNPPLLVNINNVPNYMSEPIFTDVNTETFIKTRLKQNCTNVSQTFLKHF